MKLTNNDYLYLNIAGFYIQLHFSPLDNEFLQNTFKNNILRICQNFALTQKPRVIDYYIDIVYKLNLGFHQRKTHKKLFINLYEQISENKIIVFYHVSNFQFQLILRNILQELLLRGNGFFLHSSAIKIENKVNLFLGMSGAGKSTIITLLRSDYIAMGDDNVIIKKEEGDYYFYQTPFMEKEWWVVKNPNRNIIENIYFLRKANFFKTYRMDDKDEILRLFIKQIWCRDAEEIKSQMKSVFNFIHVFNNFYYLFFGKDKEQLNLLIRNNNRKLCQ